MFWFANQLLVLVRTFSPRTKYSITRFRPTRYDTHPAKGIARGRCVDRAASTAGRVVPSWHHIIAYREPGRVSERVMGGGIPTTSSTSTSMSGKQYSARPAALDSGIAGAVSGAVSRFIVGPLVRLMCGVCARLVDFRREFPPLQIPRAQCAALSLPLLLPTCVLQLGRPIIR